MIGINAFTNRSLTAIIDKISYRWYRKRNRISFFIGWIFGAKGDEAARTQNDETIHKWNSIIEHFTRIKAKCMKKTPAISTIRYSFNFSSFSFSFERSALYHYREQIRRQFSIRLWMYDLRFPNIDRRPIFWDFTRSLSFILGVSYLKHERSILMIRMMTSSLWLEFTQVTLRIHLRT